MINAVLVLDKPASFTSHDVVNRVRRITGEAGVGHLGTLDPMATGVLPLVLGRFTRLAQFFNESIKVYEGEICFGFSTDTYDADGEAVGPVSTAQPTLEQIHRLLPAFTGRILQVPPAYSAKKIHGVAAYKLARKDKIVRLEPVEVEVHRFEIKSVCGNRARFLTEVSAGTYIRSLAHDLGQALGCGAHLTQLRRTQAGEFNLSHAVTIENLAVYHQSHAPQPSAAPGPSVITMSDNEYSDNLKIGTGQSAHPDSPYLHPRQILNGFPSVTATAEAVAAIRYGRSVNLPEFSDAPLVKVFANQYLLVAVVQRVAATLFKPRVVLYAGATRHCLSRYFRSSVKLFGRPSNLLQQSVPSSGSNSPACSRPRLHQFFQFAAEAFQLIQTLWRSLNQLALGLEDLFAVPHHQYTQHLAHAPPRLANQFQPVRRWLHQGDAVPLRQSESIRETLEGFHFKSS